jgi:hypothetical protein
MKLSTIAVLTIGITLTHFANAANIYVFDTSTPLIWQATAGGAVDATPFVVSGFGNANGQNVISITSSGGDSGTFLPGGSLANFDGFWTAKYTFTLPANAFNVQLNFINFFVDDRGVLRLNGNIISSAAVGSVVGSMVLTDGGASQPYTFAGTSGNVSGSVSSGFVTGLNTLDIIINNTGAGPVGPLKPNLINDGTAFGISGTVSYAVPEPSSTSLLLLALGGALLRNRKASATK